MKSLILLARLGQLPIPNQLLAGRRISVIGLGAGHLERKEAVESKQ